MRLGLVGAVLMACVLNGCEYDAGDGQRRASAVITDSAGVVMVRNSESGTWTDSTRWSVVETLRIGSEADTMYQFGAITSLDVDPSGQVYVLDAWVPIVRVFDRDGQFLRTIGRGGSGPGEFSKNAIAVRVATGDTIVVAEMMERRIGSFSLVGDVYGTTTIPFEEGVPTKWGLAYDGLLVHQARVLTRESDGADRWSARDRLVSRNGAGRLVDTLLELPSAEGYQIQDGAARMRVFAPEPVWAVLSDGRVAVASSDEYEVRVYEEGGVSLVFSFPASRVRIDESDRGELREFYADMFRRNGSEPLAARQLAEGIEFNPFYPVLSDLAEGPQGSIWVQRSLVGLAAFGFGERTWDVFDRNGVFSGTVTLPERFRPLRFSGDDILGLHADESGVQSVVRLRVVQPAH